MQNRLVAASKLHKHREHVAPLSGATVHSLYYDIAVDSYLTNEILSMGLAVGNSEVVPKTTQCP